MSAPDRVLGREARRLVLVDLENVAGGSLRTLEAAGWARQVVETALVVAPSEQVIIGVSSIDGLFHAKTSWPRARVVLGFGRDGADHALLDVLHDEGVAERFGHISIVSGDGIFAQAAAQLGGQGLVVTAAGWRDHMSARLCLAVNHTLLLDERVRNHVGASA